MNDQVYLPLIADWELLIELRAGEALAEIQRMTRERQEIISRRFAFLNRSIAQQRRFARLRKEK